MTAQTDTSSEEQAGSPAGGGGSFTKIAGLGVPGQRAAERLDEVCVKLTAIGLPQGADRLRRANEFVDQVDFLTLERLIDPERAKEEFTAKLSRQVQRLHSLRNGLVLFPLLVTWLALAWASIDYSGELAHHPGRVSKPFLLLWQQHFGGRIIPTFASFGISDLLLLGLVLCVTIWVNQVEIRLTRQQTEIWELIDLAMSDLAVAISSGLARLPVSADEWAEKTGRIIEAAMKQTEALAAQGREAIEQASKERAAAAAEEREFIKKFSEAISEALDKARDEYQQHMTKTAVEVTKIIQQQMNPLLSKIDGLVTEFGKHHETYRTGVTELTAGVATMSRSAEALAASAVDHAKVGVEIGANLAKVAGSQRDFADQVTKNVTSMDRSAKAMESAAELLRGEVTSSFKELTGNVVDASRNLKEVQGDLTTAAATFSTTAKALGASTTALGTSTAALAEVTIELRAAAATLRSGSRRWPWPRTGRRGV